MISKKKSYRSGLRITYDVLNAVYEVAVNVSSICRNTNLSHYAVLQVVHALENKGFVLTTIEGRTRMISITEDGRKLLKIFERFIMDIHNMGWKFS